MFNWFKNIFRHRKLVKKLENSWENTDSEKKAAWTKPTVNPKTIPNPTFPIAERSERKGSEDTLVDDIVTGLAEAAVVHAVDDFFGNSSSDSGSDSGSSSSSDSYDGGGGSFDGGGASGSWDDNS